MNYDYILIVVKIFLKEIMRNFKKEDYTLELGEVMDYMTTTLYNEFPTDVLTIEYLILSILDTRNCHANVILDNCLMSENIEELRKIYISVLERHIKPQLKRFGEVQFNDDLVNALDAAKTEAQKLNVRPIGTEHILLAILNKDNHFSETDIFEKFRLEYEFIFKILPHFMHFSGFWPGNEGSVRP